MTSLMTVTAAALTSLMTVTWHLPTHSFDGASLSQHSVQRGPCGKCVQAGGHVTLKQTSGDVTRGLFRGLHIQTGEVSEEFFNDDHNNYCTSK